MQQYDYQLSQFRKLPNPSDKKVVEHEGGDSDDEAERGAAKTGRTISTSEAVHLFQTLLEKEKVG